jgi:hypothetical protein
MTAAAALDKQIEHYRRMTGEERLAIALELHEMSCEITREGIRRQHPQARAEEVERLLRQRIESEREIEPKQT